MSFVQSFWRHMRQGLVAVVAIAAMVLSPAAVHADNYGSGTYGSDAYGSSATPSTGGGSDSGSSGSSGSSSGSSGSTAASSSNDYESTVVETESGLQVAINLSDGQVVPGDGYYITITPLNGQGKSFDKAEIYLDGVLAYSGNPDETGTLRWLWDTATNPATKVKIVVFGPGEGTKTHEFNVTVDTEDTSATPQTTSSENTPSVTPTTDGGWPLWLVLALAAGILLLVGLVIWVIIRRRRNNSQLPPPPTTFTPMQ